MLTGSIIGGPAIVGADAHVANSLLSPGSRVGGQVIDSVVGRGAVIEPGVEVCQSVVLDGAVLRAGMTLERSIVDIDVELGGSADASVEQTLDEGSGIRIYAAAAD